MGDEQEGRIESVASNKILDVGLKLLPLMVIPLIGWGIKLEVNLAVKDQQIATLQRDLTVSKASSDIQAEASRKALQDQIDKVKVEQVDIQRAANANQVTLARLEEKLNAVGTNIGEIRDLVRHR